MTTLPGPAPNKWTDRLFWVLAIAMIAGLAGFGALGVWSIVHWPWDRWASETAERAEAERRAREPVEVMARHPVEPPQASSQTPEREIGPDGSVIVNPGWTIRPGGEYPELAARRGIEHGTVVLECEGLSSGEVGACQILSETPTGAGFGQAALAGTRNARLRPASINGFKTDFTVRFTVRFVLR